MANLPQALYTAEQVRELDRRAIEDHGIPGRELMQRAAEAAFAALRGQWPDAGRVTVLCGPGNNGGDGLLIARLAQLGGMAVRVGLIRERDRYTGDARQALEAAEAAGVAVSAYDESLLRGADVVVDAMLGTGLSREVKGNIREAIGAVGACSAGVLAVDIPSGLQADTGRVLGEAVRAHVTSTFIGFKLGQFTGAGLERAGRVMFDGLGVPCAIYADLAPAGQRLTDGLRARLLPPRAKNAHKNRFGHVLCIGGDLGTAGAIRMAAEACLRCGAGLVSVATRAANSPAMTQARPELMCAAVEDEGDLSSLLNKAHVLAVGPGLGQGDWGRALWRRALAAGRPMLVDADALNLLADEPARRDDWVLTPHPGEAARLLDTGAGAVQGDRPSAVRELARRYGGVAVLKGAGTLICAADGPIYACDAGNPGMAVGGMGDTLSGVIAAFMGQGLALLDAARLGVYVHARAGDLAADEGERGLLPGDLLPHLRRLVNP
jgi:NAD(P)H-hydrate epimerase